MDQKIICSFCKNEVYKTISAINRANKEDRPMYCDRKCSAKAKITTKAEKIEAKRLYDIEYRQRTDHKQKKSESFKRNYDPIKAAIERKKTMPRHIKYCRQPEYVKKKRQYDRVRRSKVKYGDLWEVHLLTMEIQDEVLSRMTRYEIDLESNTLNKIQKRKRHEQRINREKP